MSQSSKPARIPQLPRTIRSLDELQPPPVVNAIDRNTECVIEGHWMSFDGAQHEDCAALGARWSIRSLTNDTPVRLLEVQS